METKNYKNLLYKFCLSENQYFETLIYKDKKIEEKDLGLTLQYGNKKLTSLNK